MLTLLLLWNEFLSSITRKSLQKFKHITVEEYKLLEFLAEEEDGADFVSINLSIWSPMERAIVLGDAEIVRLLIQKYRHYGINVNIPNCLHFTPLTYAIDKGQLKIIELLINSAANVNLKDDYGWTPLTMAILNGNINVITLLLQSGADINLVDGNDQTPILTAIVNQRVEALKVLIKYGADVNFKPANVPTTPLLEAVQTNDPEIVKLLISNGANNHNSFELAMSTNQISLLKTVLYPHF